MTKTNFIAAAAVALFAVAGAAQAEQYEGVHQFNSTASRAEVNAQAVAAAHAKDQNVTRGSRGAEKVAVSGPREPVVAGAVRAAHAPDQNVSSGSRVNSKVVSTMANPMDVAAQSAAK